MKNLEEMTIEEIELEIKDLRESSFYLDMKDRWDESDYETSKEWNEKIHILEKELERRLNN